MVCLFICVYATILSLKRELIITLGIGSSGEQELKIRLEINQIRNSIPLQYNLKEEEEKINDMTLNLKKELRNQPRDVVNWADAKSGGNIRGLEFES